MHQYRQGCGADDLVSNAAHLPTRAPPGSGVICYPAGLLTPRSVFRQWTGVVGSTPRGCLSGARAARGGPAKALRLLDQLLQTPLDDRGLGVEALLEHRPEAGDLLF